MIIMALVSCVAKKSPQAMAHGIENIDKIWPPITGFVEAQISEEIIQVWDIRKYGKRDQP